MVYLKNKKGDNYFYQTFGRGKVVKVKKHEDFFYIYLGKKDEFGSGICLGTDEWGKLALIMKRMESMKKELEKRKKGDKRKVEEGDEEEVQTNKKSKKQKPNPFISDQAGEGTSGGWRQKKKILFSESLNMIPLNTSCLFFEKKKYIENIRNYNHRKNSRHM
ncbi:unnamed protein product [Mytilus edulis]|uniref:Cyclic nucleotide-binding domain-containing protein n=1 Tax=Mytilus edulis TaxID=6550 RepID=A0A8S3PYR2_MYTED|nr:unnamed protein product [Mytilus edulis]